MDYIQLLVSTYNVTRLSHELGKMLSKVTAEKGKLLVPEGFSNKLIEFMTSLNTALEASALEEVHNADNV